MTTTQNLDMGRVAPDHLIEVLIHLDTYVPISVDEQRWLKLIQLLPVSLQRALLNELTLGNRVTAIQYGDWPQRGSVVVSLASALKGTYGEGNEYGVTYRWMNDPHYWTADIHADEAGVQHLIIY